MWLFSVETGFKECLLDQCRPSGKERERARWLVWGVARRRPHACLYSLSGQIISIASKQGCRSWLGGLLCSLSPLTNTHTGFHTHRGDRLDFKPAQDAGEFICGGVGGPLDPHVLLTKWQRHQMRTNRAENNWETRFSFRGQKALRLAAWFRAQTRMCCGKYGVHFLSADDRWVRNIPLGVKSSAFMKTEDLFWYWFTLLERKCVY